MTPTTTTLLYFICFSAAAVSSSPSSQLLASLSLARDYFRVIKPTATTLTASNNSRTHTHITTKRAEPLAVFELLINFIACCNDKFVFCRFLFWSLGSPLYTWLDPHIPHHCPLPQRSSCLLVSAISSAVYNLLIVLRTWIAVVAFFVLIRHFVLPKGWVFGSQGAGFSGGMGEQDSLFLPLPLPLPLHLAKECQPPILEEGNTLDDSVYMSTQTRAFWCAAAHCLCSFCDAKRHPH